MCATQANVPGLTPEQWEKRLEAASDDPTALDAVLGELEQEMRKERTWLHENPTPGALFKAIFRFLGKRDQSLEELGEQIKDELHIERVLKKRYRSWLPGEHYLDRLFPYLKDFGAEVRPDTGGLQFPGFLKYKGIHRASKNEVFAFYLSERFPGRDPANFHLSFEPHNGKLVIKRVYKMELPRIAGITTVGRAVLAELVGDIIESKADIRRLVVDNAANVETRRALIRARPTDDGVVYEPVPHADVAKTPLGHLMAKLARELCLMPGEHSIRVNPFGVLKIVLPVCAG